MDTNYKNIPSFLKQLNQFCCYDSRDKEYPKAPRDLKGKLLKSWSNRSLYTFNECIESIKQGYNNGIGIILKDNGIIILDYDKCIDSIEVNDDLGYTKPIFKKDIEQDILNDINLLQSYTELSKSGNGIHIITLADVKDIYIQKPIEIYSKNKFICLTGNVILNYYDLNETTGEMLDIINRYQDKTSKPPTKLKYNKSIYNDFMIKNFKYYNKYTDNEILNTMFKSKNGDYIKKLYNNELNDADYIQDKRAKIIKEQDKAKQEHRLNAIDTSNSGKAYTLILYLIDFCYGDLDAVKRIFKKSALCNNDYLEPRYKIQEDNQKFKIDKLDYMIKDAVIKDYQNYREFK